MELLASDTSSIEGGPPFSAEPHRVGNFDERKWGISVSAVTLGTSAAAAAATSPAHTPQCPDRVSSPAGVTSSKVMGTTLRQRQDGTSRWFGGRPTPVRTVRSGNWPGYLHPGCLPKRSFVAAAPLGGFHCHPARADNRACLSGAMFPFAFSVRCVVTQEPSGYPSELMYPRGGHAFPWRLM